MQAEHILFKNHTALYEAFLQFEKNILQLATEMNLILSDFEVDHIAFRVNQCKTAKSYLDIFVKYGEVISDNVINGRAIYLIELEQPILLLGQDVQIIELPFPKGKVYPQESWEHIEVVIPFLAEESCEQWVERIKNRFQWNQSESLCVKVDEPRADGERLRNPSIAVSFVHSDNHQVCIKVHPYNIKKIIEV